MHGPLDHTLLDVFFGNTEREEHHCNSLMITEIDEDIIKITFKLKLTIIPIHEDAWDAFFQSIFLDDLFIPILKQLVIRFFDARILSLMQVTQSPEGATKTPWREIVESNCNETLS
jgi:hypothetical protein